MSVLRTILTVIFILVCVAVTVLILMQQGKEEGLGSLGGISNSDSYFNQNRVRTVEGSIVRATKWLTGAVIVLAVVLNLGF